jgi:type II secretion system protein C
MNALIEHWREKWLPYLVSRGPKFATLALGMLLALEAGRLSWAIVEGRRHAEVPMPVSASMARARAGVDIAGITAAHLFGSAEKPPEQDASAAVATSSPLVLTGVFAFQDPKRGFAIIGDGGLSRVYTVGAAIAGALLHSIYPDHVILDRNGQLEILTFPHLRQLFATQAPRLPVRGRGRQRAIEERTPVAHPLKLGDMVRVGGPTFDASNAVTGYALYPGRSPRAFEASGLQNGDLLVAIDGQPVENVEYEDGMKVIERMKSAGRATVTVIRAEQRRDVSIDVSAALPPEAPESAASAAPEPAADAPT